MMQEFDYFCSLQRSVFVHLCVFRKRSIGHFIPSLSTILVLIFSFAIFCIQLLLQIKRWCLSFGYLLFSQLFFMLKNSRLLISNGAKINHSIT
jgi:hypothetical protein